MQPNTENNDNFAQSNENEALTTQDCDDKSVDDSTNNKTKTKFEELKEHIYKICYVVGIQLIRQQRRFTKKVVVKHAKAQNYLTAKTTSLIEKFKKIGTVTTHEIKKPVLEGFEWTLEMEEKFAQAKRDKKVVSFLLGCAKEFARTTAHNIWVSRNYVFPVAAAFVFAFSLIYVNGLTFALSVEYGGDFVGYVKSEEDFDAAENEVMNRIIYEDYVYPEDVIPHYTLRIVSDSDIATPDDLINNIIQVSGNELSEGYGLYIDSRFVGATDDEGELADLLNSFLAKYDTGNEDDVIEFVKPVEVKEGLYPVTSVVDITVMRDLVSQDETEQRTYTVQKGDAPTLIAQRYNMLYADLKSLNPEIETKLFVGQEVLIQRSVPLLGVQVKKVEVYNEDIPFKVIQIQDTTQLQGYTKVKQIGQKGVTEITANVVYIDGVEISREIVDTIVLKEAVDEEMIVGGKRPLEQIPVTARTTSANFIWPVDGGYVSCGFYGYYNHGGIDIAAKAGTGVRASASGTVELATNYTGNAYGRYVIINHGGGVKTLYAHNSEVYVEVGQWVEQGQLIAGIGRTGNATGNHCHFEIRINGVRQNPAAYIGNVYNR